MKSDKISRAIGGIDDDLIESADSGEAHRPGAIRTMWISAAAVFVLLLAGAFALPGIFNGSDPTADPGEEASQGTTTGGAIPTGQPDSPWTFVGEPITEEEAAAYLEANRADIFSALSAEGVDISGAGISDTGCCHIRYDGAQGAGPAVIRDRRDYLVCQGDRPVAVVTLSKEEGSLGHSVASGAPWYDEYGAYLAAHRGQELICLRAGDAEIVLAPDGDHFDPDGGVTAYLSGIEAPYTWFYSQDAVFVP